MSEIREVSVATIQYRNGTSQTLGAFFRDDAEAFGEMMDLMQNMCQKDENITAFGLEILSTVGELQKACQI